ncbi:unnamed protein product [Symbiodinium necroappetens]|uniref:JmjC domain-containing protein n=1 Tax=Symbiodinium necroappetens TaxID=1628268 RepID=A0A813CAE3_9DINO|nr:unnamed protein product [Symbiodinium necroappetens]
MRTTTAETTEHMLPYLSPPRSLRVAADPRHSCRCRRPPAQFGCASSRSLNAVVFAFGSRLAVKSRRWPGIHAPNTQASAVWPDPSAELREAGDTEQGLVLEDCTASVSLDEMRPHRMGGLIDGWAARSWTRDLLVEQFGRLEFRVRPCETLNQYGYAGPSESYLSLEEYLSADFDGRSVVFENDFESNRHELLESFDVPPLLASVHGAPILSIGRQDTGIGFHRHSAAWLAQLLGRKLWLLLPGGKRPPARAPWQYLQHRPPGLVPWRSRVSYGFR